MQTRHPPVGMLAGKAPIEQDGRCSPLLAAAPLSGLCLSHAVSAGYKPPQGACCLAVCHCCLGVTMGFGLG